MLTHNCLRVAACADADEVRSWTICSALQQALSCQLDTKGQLQNNVGFSLQGAERVLLCFALRL